MITVCAQNGFSSDGTWPLIETNVDLSVNEIGGYLLPSAPSQFIKEINLINSRSEGANSLAVSVIHRDFSGHCCENLPPALDYSQYFIGIGTRWPPRNAKIQTSLSNGSTLLVKLSCGWLVGTAAMRYLIAI